MGRDDDRAHDRQLRLSDRTARDVEGNLRTGDSHRGTMMRDDSPYSWNNPWMRWSIVALATLTVVSFLIGFVLLPSVQRDYRADGLWATICRAAGVPAKWIDDGS